MKSRARCACRATAKKTMAAMTSFFDMFSRPADNKLTTSNGAPVDSLTASQTAGCRGPITLQDFTLIDHLAHFDRERIPERVVHAKGAGAFGYFEVTTNNASKYCRAQFLSKVGKRTPIAARFSTVGGESGSAGLNVLKIYFKDSIFNIFL